MAYHKGDIARLNALVLQEGNELDTVAYGLPIRLRRHSDDGHWCGYVGVPSQHPLFKVEYNEAPSEWSLPPGCMVKVHGGLTFSGAAFDNEGEYWWFGFDCHHTGNISMKTLRSTYRDLRYVLAEAVYLAQQLSLISAGRIE